jgi:hypothetical protein
MYRGVRLREKIPLRDFGRLKLTLTIAMLGFIIDTLVTRWMLSSNGYYESNTMLYPQIGVPIMVLNYIIFDHFIPRTTLFDNIFYTLSLTQWSGLVQNLLVLLNITNGINFFYALPFMLIGGFVVLNFKINRREVLH